MNLEKAILQERFGSEQEKLMINIIFTSNFINLQTIRIFKSFNISAQQYNVLRILRGQKGNPISIKEIEIRMLDKSSNVSRLIDKLMWKDLVDRAFSIKDRRKIALKITLNGLTLLKDIDPLITTFQDKFKGLVTSDVAKKVNDVLDSLRENNNK